MSDSPVNQIFGIVDGLEKRHQVTFANDGESFVWRWSELCKLIYRRYGLTRPHATATWRRIVPAEMFLMEDQDEAHIYLSVVNSFYLVGRDPRLTQEIVFDGELLTIQLTWLGLFCHYYGIMSADDDVQSRINNLVNLMSEVYHWEYIPPRETVLFKYL